MTNSKGAMNIITIQGEPAPDCKKCGSRVITDKDTGKQYTVECAYPENCPIKKGVQLEKDDE